MDGQKCECCNKKSRRKYCFVTETKKEDGTKLAFRWYCCSVKCALFIAVRQAREHNHVFRNMVTKED